MILAFCTACPEDPFVKLSKVEKTLHLPDRLSVARTQHGAGVGRADLRDTPCIGHRRAHPAWVRRREMDRDSHHPATARLHHGGWSHRHRAV